MFAPKFNENISINAIVSIFTPIFESVDGRIDRHVLSQFCNRVSQE